MNSTAPIKPGMLLIQISILLAAFGILFGTTIASLAKDWMANANYSHGFLIPIISGYMIWQKREQLKRISIEPSNYGLMLILFGMFVFILGRIGAELFTTRTAIIITIAGLCTYSFGSRMAVAVAVPLSYLIFMIPLPAIIWNKIAFPLQLAAARLSANVVQLMGIPILREGNVLFLSNTTLEVVDACSGLRSLTSLLALSVAFAYISKNGPKSKIVLILSAIPIALIVNVLRLTSTVMLARYVSPRAAEGFLHELSGIIVFILSLIMLYGLHAIMQKIGRLHDK